MCDSVGARQLVLLVCHGALLVLDIVSNLFHYLQEIWNFELVLLCGRFNFEQTGLSVDIEVGLNQKVLLRVDETLPQLLDGLLGAILA